MNEHGERRESQENKFQAIERVTHVDFLLLGDKGNMKKQSFFFKFFLVFLYLWALGFLYRGKKRVEKSREREREARKNENGISKSVYRYGR